MLGVVFIIVVLYFSIKILVKENQKWTVKNQMKYELEQSVLK